jgi:hypothetical protein
MAMEADRPPSGEKQRDPFILKSAEEGMGEFGEMANHWHGLSS